MVKSIEAAPAEAVLAETTEDLEEQRFPYPVGFGGLLAVSGRIWKRSIAKLVGPFTIAYLLAYLSTSVGLLQLGDFWEQVVNFIGFVIVPTMIFSLAVAIANPVLASAIVRDPIGIRDSGRLLRGRTYDLISAALGAALGASVLTMFLGPIGLLLSPVVFGPPIFVQLVTLESRSWGEAWESGKALLVGRKARVFLNLLTVVALVMVIQLSLLSAAVVFEVTTAQAIAQLAINIAFGALVYPFVAAAGLVAYLDLRARSEELDHGTYVEEVAGWGARGEA